MWNNSSDIDEYISNATAVQKGVHTDRIIGLMFSITAVSCLATLLFNATIILVYFRHPHLRTPFNAYVANLCILEFLLAVTSMPGNLIREYYGYWPWNDFLCGLFLYCDVIFSAAVRYGHVLIALNRLWAVAFPVRYKEWHTKKVATILIFCAFGFVNILNLPVIVRGRIWKDPYDIECLINTSFQYHTALFVEIFSFTLTELMVLLPCPFILWKLHRKRLHSSESGVNLNQSGPACTTHSFADHPPVMISLCRKRRSVSITLELDHEIRVYQITAEAKRRKLSTMIRAKHAKSSSHNRILLYLALAVIVFWTPNHVYWIMVYTSKYWNSVFFAVQQFCILTNSWVNPLLFYTGMGKLRDAVNDLFKSVYYTCLRCTKTSK